MLKNLISLFFKKKQDKIPVKKNGRWKEFSKQGVLISEGDYRDDLRSGNWKFYYETGELAIEETYETGSLEGIFKSYYKNGQTISFGRYINNRREGKFVIFNELGQVVKTMTFKGDILMEEIEMPVEVVKV